MQADSSEVEPLQCKGIRFTNEAVMELDDLRPVVKVPTSEIQRISLGYGFQARHPLLMSAFGLVLAIIGLLPIPGIIHWLLYGGVIHTLQAAAVALTLFGAWAIYDGFRRGYFLLVEEGNKARNLVFTKKPDASELEEFLNKVKIRFGYDIERNVN